MLKRLYKRFLEWMLAPVLDKRPETRNCIVVDKRKEGDDQWFVGAFDVVPVDD